MRLFIIYELEAHFFLNIVLLQTSNYLQCYMQIHEPYCHLYKEKMPKNIHNYFPQLYYYLQFHHLKVKITYCYLDLSIVIQEFRCRVQILFCIYHTIRDILRMLVFSNHVDR